MSNKKNKIVVKKRKIKKKVILISLIVIALIGLGIYGLMQVHITNIYITNNEYISDYEIIKLAKLEYYPKSLENDSLKIKKRLEKSKLIQSVNVKKRGLFHEVYIDITENKPLFYYQMKNKVILEDGKEFDGNYDLPIVTNEIDTEVFDEFVSEMDKVNQDIMVKISEIKYDPNDIDKERFYLTMNDGNYVYLTLNKFSKINNYISIVKEFNNVKGILYLDSGEYFEIFKEETE
ncbi:MAG: FtsQ-type POTRA domain-containing protein [Bacilli bacterium]|nr:FtsQ-type POTRA domain-containing protein [Bacilli bacterium]